MAKDPKNLKSRVDFKLDAANEARIAPDRLELHDQDVKSMSLEDRVRRLENIIAGKDLWA